MAGAAAAGGVVTNGNELVLPTRNPVAMTVTSGDVMHAFWAPNLGGQRNATPGTEKTWQIDTDRPGVYQGNCSMLCGASHANMRFKVVALEPERYNAFRSRTVEELIGALRSAWADRSVQSVILTAVGDKAFCTGGDVRQRAETGDYGPTESGMFEIGNLHK